jgi:hypothetical protein
MGEVFSSYILNISNEDFDKVDNNIEKYFKDNFYCHRDVSEIENKKQKYLSCNIRDAFSHGNYELIGEGKEIDRIVIRNKSPDPKFREFRFVMCIKIADFIAFLEKVVEYEAGKGQS